MVFGGSALPTGRSGQPGGSAVELPQVLEGKDIADHLLVVTVGHAEHRLQGGDIGLVQGPLAEPVNHAAAWLTDPALEAGCAGKIAERLLNRPHGWAVTAWHGLRLDGAEPFVHRIQGRRPLLDFRESILMAGQDCLQDIADGGGHHLLEGLGRGAVQGECLGDFALDHCLEATGAVPLHRPHVLPASGQVVGVGSVGLLAFVVLLQGRDENDLLVLQVKQAVASVLEPVTSVSAEVMSGQRVVYGQQLMQAASDVFLGWIRGPGGRDYYIRQLRDMKFAPDPASLDASSLAGYATICGRTLARGHARGGDAVAIATYLGSSTKFDRAVRDFSLTYADQVARDFAAYQAAIASGSVHVAAPGEGANYRFTVTAAGGFDIESSGMSPATPAAG